MTIIYDAQMHAKLVQWAADHRAMYIASGGTRGHIMDARFLGGHRFQPMVLIRYVGRKSGRTMITPLGYANLNGQVVIGGSKGGAEEHPAWYLNIKSGSPLAFQIGTQAFDASWREPEGAELDRAWAAMQDQNPPFRDYPSATRRKIPLILMQALDEIPVFTE